ncbi:hypothetical protein EYF80_049556 [Liparis tanakae]|uniref:Uncharacterized protein n=1 Tax=Liparis tanakae TaxID=230148 RepID=A0A4Z2FGE3_9TELE|nr:hypothetical protein EYF80_049556 [Liparis tanakae]
MSSEKRMRKMSSEKRMRRRGGEPCHARLNPFRVSAPRVSVSGIIPTGHMTRRTTSNHGAVFGALIERRLQTALHAPKPRLETPRDASGRRSSAAAVGLH